MHICTNELCGLTVFERVSQEWLSSRLSSRSRLFRYPKLSVDNEARAVDGSSQTFGPFSAWPSCHLMVFTSARDPELELLLKTV